MEIEQDDRGNAAVQAMWDALMAAHRDSHERLKVWRFAAAVAAVAGFIAGYVTGLR